MEDSLQTHTRQLGAHLLAPSSHVWCGQHTGWCLQTGRPARPHRLQQSTTAVLWRRRSVLKSRTTPHTKCRKGVWNQFSGLLTASDFRVTVPGCHHKGPSPSCQRPLQQLFVGVLPWVDFHITSLPWQGRDLLTNPLSSWAGASQGVGA